MIGVLLINLGTPDSPSVGDVRKYLKQFLSDPLVIDINPIARSLLLNCIILPFRSPKSAEAYQKIWTERGSPLFFHTDDLTKKVQERLGDDYRVQMAMRYGRPSIETGLKKLVDAGVDRLVIFPLYPQYASSSTESTMREVFEVAGRIKLVPHINAVQPFYSHSSFIHAFAERGRPLLQNFHPDHLLFSFHGLPERHILKLDKSKNYCLKDPECCDKMVQANQACYRAHSFHTARMIAEELKPDFNIIFDHSSPLAKEVHSRQEKIPSTLKPLLATVSFQSRLGRTPWIKPYTDIVIPQLAQKGIKRLAIYCPSFVADCLETLEEINIRARELFLENGGEDLLMIPSLNAEPLWVHAVCEMVKSVK